MSVRRRFPAVCFCVFLSFAAALAVADSVADWEKAAELRKKGELTRAESAVKKYGSPASFERLNPTQKVEFLRGLLKLAHIRALNDDVTGALALLNWAESRPDEFQ